MSDKFQSGIKAGSTDVSVPLELRDASDSTALTGKAHTDVTAYYWRQGESATSISAASLANEASTHTDGGFVEVDATNLPGVYRFDLPDAAVATGADWVVVGIKVTGAFQQNFMFPLTTNVVQGGDSYARLGAPAGASIAADIATVDGNVDAILVDTGTTLPATLTTIASYIDTEVAAIKAVTDNLPDSGALTSLASASALATVDTVVDAIKIVTDNLPESGALTTLTSNVADILTDTGTTIPAQISGLNDPTVAAIADAVWDEAQAGHTTAGTFGKYLDTEVSGVGGGSLTVSAIADGVWDEATSGHVSAGTFGALAADILTDTGTTIPGLISGISTGTGSGAYTITVTVTDGTDPIQNAAVRVLDGSTTAAYGLTDASGNIEFSLDSATYTVAITKTNFQFTPESRTVTGDEAGTLTNDLEMTALATSPSSTSVRTVSFRDVLHGVARRKGLDPNVNLQDNEAATLTEYIRAAYEFIWRWYPWPESVTIERVTFANQELARSGTTAYAIDQVFGISVNHPITNVNPTPVGYKVAGAKVYVTDSSYASSSLYVAYRRPVPTFTATDYSASATYAVDDVIFFTDGDCYRCIDATSAGESPTTHAAKWEKQEIIDYLKNAVIHGAMVEALGEEGQHSTSLIEDGKLQGYLEQELDRIELDQGMTRWITTSAGEYSSRR